MRGAGGLCVQPVVGGGAPVLRAWLLADRVPTTFDVSVGARLEVIVLGSFWLLITVLGAGYQLALQLGEVLAGRAGWSAVTDVLPGLAVMAGILALGFWLLRRRSVRDAALLLAAFRDAVGDPGAEPPLVPAPIH